MGAVGRALPQIRTSILRKRCDTSRKVHTAKSPKPTKLDNPPDRVARLRPLAKPSKRRDMVSSVLPLGSQLLDDRLQGFTLGNRSFCVHQAPVAEPPSSQLCKEKQQDNTPAAELTLPVGLHSEHNITSRTSSCTY